MTDREKEKYSRQIIMPEIGTAGQERLLSSSVIVIGAGALASASLYYIAAAGVGKITIADGDKVELSNLHRQIIHSYKSIGTKKAESARESLLRLDPYSDIKTINERIDERNIKDIIKDYDFIVDATDNFPSKFTINDACVDLKKPYSHAGIVRFSGQTMTYVPGVSACLRYIFPESPGYDERDTCKVQGVLGAAVGVIGSIQACETIKYLLGIKNLLTDRLLCFDGLNMTFRTINTAGDSPCSTAQERCKHCRYASQKNTF